MSTPQDLKEIRRRTGRIWWEFWRENDQSQNIRHEIKAAKCVTKTWPKDAKAFEPEAVKWAAEHAQAVCDRLDYEESAEGKTVAAEEQYRQLKDTIEHATAEREELKTDYPTISDTSAEVAK